MTNDELRALPTGAQVSILSFRATLLEVVALVALVGLPAAGRVEFDDGTVGTYFAEYISLAEPVSHTDQVRHILGGGV